MTDPRAVHAAKNNADLCAAVFAARGLAFARRAAGFVAINPPPPFYPHVSVTSVDDAAVADLIAEARNRFGDGIVVKDSFCRIDAAAQGFRVRFGAFWIRREAARSGMPDGWMQVDTSARLTAWEAGWSGDTAADAAMFPPAFLKAPGVFVIGRAGGAAFDAGCLVNLSDGVAGLSNVFGPAGAFADAACAAQSVAPGRPLVGYESGSTLRDARACGFAACGELRVLTSGA
ncbi:hypothetical protein MWU52_16560 [Jannaschia sp. S6380]|uniref:hypothetical protein n=1 Tax=Jannaschia sp. S6380 TaxID=2926408 RepID=UPI001FF3B514|nr:hypothetical protein [Jannaschia sp. S6380]MCK0169168.1 hypothetical protein [Jannaschia sp. S6380]